MYMLQLFDSSDEVHPVDARLLRDGVLRVGRDNRRGLVNRGSALRVVAHALRIRGRRRRSDPAFARCQRRVQCDHRRASAARCWLARRSAFRGSARRTFRIVASEAPHGDIAGNETRTMVLTPPLGDSLDVPSDWIDKSDTAARANPTLQAARFLRRSAQGAGLDASLLSKEDPVEIMRRVGGVYRQMVLGVGDLMSERDQARAQYQMTRTTIGSADNNPFKWAPTQRLAIDLILGSSHGFLSGPAALQSSFRDIKRHLVATFAGLRGSLRAAIDHCDPARLT
jgi:predicted component of type VI protein secretion system